MIQNVFLALGLILLASAAYAGIQGAPWMPTWKKDLKRIGRLVALQRGEKFVELGCGNGRVCRHLAATTQAGKIVGVELSLLQWMVANVQVAFLRSQIMIRSVCDRKRNSPPFSIVTWPTFVLGNAFTHPLSDYDVVYLFLTPKAYKKIRPKLEAELKPGARVVTYVWPIDGWEEDVLDMAEGQPNLFLYRR
ncbi:class I SAM-dependent methyltransferase [Candidatus Uhrbacteria bacterium]|nr:class I SAM-dependent methyltransferase [Candidatus Uhrbacteria bacterium]